MWIWAELAWCGCYEEASVAAGGPAMSSSNESEGDNADAIEHDGVQPHIDGDQEAVIQRSNREW